MKRFLLKCLFTLLVMVCVACAGQADFVPATFSGLTVGKAAVSDFKNSFGEPREFFENKVSSKIWMRYENIGPYQEM